MLHHALVMKAEQVLFIAARRNEVAYMTLVSFPEDTVQNCFGILDKFNIRYLKWTFLGSTDTFLRGELSGCSLAQSDYDVNIQRL